MEILNAYDIKQIIDEIKGSSEVSRRAMQKRRHDMYKDDSKKFLIEQIKREFSADAIQEMRLAPINVLKKIINKRSVIYRVPPQRVATEQDQPLVDYYAKELSLDWIMGKANKYYNLFSNTVLYCIPHGDKLKLVVVPPYLYSIVPNKFEPTKIDAYIFNAFTEYGTVAPQADVGPATGIESYQRDPGYAGRGDLVASNEKDSDQGRIYIFWTAQEHFTTDDHGNKLFLIPSNQDAEQFVNPIGICPVVNLAKDRDAESWSTQGADLYDNCLNFQIGWTDLLTISKHQGFSVMTIVSETEPKKLTVGVNRAVWLKQAKDGPTPSITYAQANSPLQEYNDVLMEYLGLILTSNDMNPSTVSGKENTQNYTSGFSRLIQMADALEAIEMDKPVLKTAEHDLWQVIKGWHNFMFDQNLLNDEAKSLGKFSEDFDVAIVYNDMKPIESEQDRIAAVKSLMDMGLVTKADAIKRLHPDMSVEQVEEKLKEIQAEKMEAVESFSMPMTQEDDQEDMDEGQI